MIGDGKNYFKIFQALISIGSMSRKQCQIFIDKRCQHLWIFSPHLYVEFFRSHNKWMRSFSNFDERRERKNWAKK